MPGPGPARGTKLNLSQSVGGPQAGRPGPRARVSARASPWLRAAIASRPAGSARPRTFRWKRVCGSGGQGGLLGPAGQRSWGPGGVVSHGRRRRREPGGGRGGVGRVPPRPPQSHCDVTPAARRRARRRGAFFVGLSRITRLRLGSS